MLQQRGTLQSPHEVELPEVCRKRMVLAHRLGLVVGIHGHTNITSEKRTHHAKTWHDRMPGAESGLRCFPSWGIMRSEPDLDDPEIQSTAERQS